ncbi:MAG: family 20 glycosylhydrolase [Oscillospiraceae bacterium]|nr:family 20 glycosylhydrolase [Oscillospiraceae bacterium]
MYIGSLLSSKSGISPTISYNKIGSSLPFAPELYPDTEGAFKLKFSESVLVKGGSIGWKWDSMLLCGADIMLEFTKRVFVDKIFFTLPDAPTAENAELFWFDGNNYAKCGEAVRNGGKLSGNIEIEACVNTDIIIVRLHSCMSNIIIKSLDITGAVFDTKGTFPLADDICVHSNRAIPLSEISEVVCDGESDSAFGRELFIEFENERGFDIADNRRFWYSGTKKAVSFLTDNAFPDEFFSINSDSAGCVIKSGSRRGFVYAAAALSQLCSDGYIPLISLNDKPYLKMRGVHFGIPARDQIPFVKRLIKYILAPMRYNMIFMEVAGGMKYDLHPEINEMWSLIRDKMTAGEWPYCGHIDMDAKGDYLEKSEIRDLVDYAESFGIEIIPEVQSLSHVQYLTKCHPEIAEVSDEKRVELNVKDLRLADIPTNDFYPDCYCPSNEKSYELIFDVLDEVIEAFHPKKFVHMGHDEVYTHNVCPVCKNKTAAELVSSDINRIHEHLKKHGLRMAIWGDMVNDINWYAAPDAIDLIPKDIMLLDFIWYYDFSRDTEARLLDHGFEVMIGNMYSSHFPRFETRTARKGIAGAQVSTWVAVDEKTLSYEGKLYDFIFTGNMMWSSKYDSRAFYSYARAITPLLPEIRSRVHGDKNAQMPSRSGKFDIIALCESKEYVPFSISRAVQRGKSVLKGVEFNIENVLTAASSHSLSGAPQIVRAVFSGKCDSLVFLYGCENPVMRVAWKPMIKVGEIIISYSDNTHTIADIEFGYNIYDISKKYGKPLESAYYRHEGYSGTYTIDAAIESKDIAGKDLTLYSYELINPHPEKLITKVEIKAEEDPAVNIHIFAITAARR